MRVRQGARDLLPTTSLTLRGGEVAVAVGPPGGGHTSLALVLAGRLRLDAGRVELDGDASPRVLQAAVALVDVPGVSEPDEVVPFRTILGEELAMAKHKPSAAAIDARLEAHGLDEQQRAEVLAIYDRGSAPLDRVDQVADGNEQLASAMPDLVAGLSQAADGAGELSTGATKLRDGAVQLVTAGGTFPWQTVPEPLHWLHHILPMSYAVDGLRQLMYGGLSGRVVADAFVLAAFLVGALLLTSYGARRQRVWTPKRVRPEIAI